MYTFRGVRQSGNCINGVCAELRNINNQNIEPAFEAEFLILSAADTGIAILCLNCLRGSESASRLTFRARKIAEVNLITYVRSRIHVTTHSH